MSSPDLDNPPTDLPGDVANELLVDAAECVNALLDALPADQAETLQKHPMLVAVHALLELLDRRTVETRQHQDALIEALCDLQESIDFMAGVASFDAEAVGQTQAAKDYAEGARHVQAAKDYDRLKWLVDRARPGMSESEYREMYAFIQRLSGL